MIIGLEKHKSALENLFETLEQSPWKFQLTGSRYFGNFGQNSDWDFFTQNNEEVCMWLRQRGFALIDWKKYLQGYKALREHGSIVEMYQYKIRNTGEQIQIQVVTDFDRKCRLQELLKVFQPMTNINTPKIVRSQFWDLADALVPVKEFVSQ